MVDFQINNGTSAYFAAGNVVRNIGVARLLSASNAGYVDVAGHLRRMPPSLAASAAEIFADAVSIGGDGRKEGLANGLPKHWAQRFTYTLG